MRRDCDWTLHARVFLTLRFCVISCLLIISSLYAYRTGNDNSDAILRLKRSESRDHILLVGGFDGKFYGIEAWTGDILYSFDSGGPLMQNYNCLHANDDTHKRSYFMKNSVDQKVGSVATRQRTVTEVEDSGEATQIVPSYDGSLYYFIHNQFRKLKVSITDIMRTNGPVHVLVERQCASLDVCPAPQWADVLLVGEKRTKMFALNVQTGAVEALIDLNQPVDDPWILLGRSEYNIKAVERLERPTCNCLKISEYFLELTKCMGISDLNMLQKQESASSNAIERHNTFNPRIMVLQNDVNDKISKGTAFSAYDPKTNELLWKREILDFEAVAVFGIHVKLGETFFKWQLSGPSSTITEYPIRTRTQNLLPESSSASPYPLNHVQSEKSKGFIMDFSIAYRSLHEFSRLLDLQRIDAREGSTMSHATNDEKYMAQATSMKNRDTHSNHELAGLHFYGSQTLKSHAFWHRMQNGGDDGIFITFANVGAMLAGICTCWILIAWRCYIKGLATSFAQHHLPSALLDSHNQLFGTRDYQLRLQYPDAHQIHRSARLDVSTETLKLAATPWFSYLPILIQGHIRKDKDRSVKLFFEINAKNDQDQDAHTRDDQMVTGQSLNYRTVPSAWRCPPSTAICKLECVFAESVARVTKFEDLKLESLAQTDSEIKNSSHGNVGCNVKFNTSARVIADIYAISKMQKDESMQKSYATIEPTDLASVSASSQCCVNQSTDQVPVANGVTDSSAVLSSKQKATFSALCLSQTDAIELEQPSSKLDLHMHQNTITNGEDRNALLPFVCQSRFANEFVQVSDIGKGGFGHVILAENRLDGRKYAIKRIGLNLKNQTPSTLQKFLREVKILALLDHPNIVRYYQAWLEKVDVEQTIEHISRQQNCSDHADSEGTFGPAPRHSLMENLRMPSMNDLSFDEDILSTAQIELDNASTRLEDDGGFDWERDEEKDLWNEGLAWNEEDLLVSKTDYKDEATTVKANGSCTDHNTESTASQSCDHWLYIQMQYCAGKSLADYLSSAYRSMDLLKLLQIFLQIASALAHVHSCGLIHRDLKPANIFVADIEIGSIKLGDFGLSRYATNVNLHTGALVMDEISAVNSVTDARLDTSRARILRDTSVSNMSESADITAGVGTYMYASPEQVAGKKYNAKTDLYSLGMILFELCHPPFATTMERVITLRSARDRLFSKDQLWYQECQDIVIMLQKLLSPMPSERPSANMVKKWCENLYEKHLVISSPLYRSIQANHAAMNRLGSLPCLDALGTLKETKPVLSTLSMALKYLVQVEAKILTQETKYASDAVPNDAMDRYALPDHSLLKEICNVITKSSDGNMEIKRYALQMQEKGVQAFDFVVEYRTAGEATFRDSRALSADMRSFLSLNLITSAIKAIPGIRSVRNTPIY